jgi:hypothetical protein
MAIFRCVGYFYFHSNNKEKASRQTHTQETTKLVKKKRTKTQMERCRVSCKKKRQKTSETDSFRNMKIKISYTSEYGYVGPNM